MIATPALWVALGVITPLMVLMAWLDLKYLRIPNWLVLAVFATFVVTGLWGLPLEVFLWRLAQGAGMLVAGFLVFQFGVIGGGDAKMLAALAPFVSGHDIGRLMAIYLVTTFAMLMILWLAMRMLRHRDTGWAAFDQAEGGAIKRFIPMGLIFGITIIGYLAMHAGLSV